MGQNRAQVRRLEAMATYIDVLDQHQWHGSTRFSATCDLPIRFQGIHLDVAISIWGILLLDAETGHAIWGSEYRNMTKIGHNQSIFKFYLGEEKFRFSMSGHEKDGKRVYEQVKHLTSAVTGLLTLRPC